MKFHLRRLDREIKDLKAIIRLLNHSQYFILSMSDGDESLAEKLSRDAEGVKQRLQKIFGGGEEALDRVVFAKIVVEELT